MNKIKTWQERYADNDQGLLASECKELEIAELRAALASSATTERPSDLAAAIQKVVFPKSTWDGGSNFTFHGKPYEYTKDDLMEYRASVLDALAKQVPAQEQDKARIEELHSKLKMLADTVVLASEDIAKDRRQIAHALLQNALDEVGDIGEVA